MRAALLVRCSTRQQDFTRQVDDLREICEDYGFEESGIYGEYITGKDSVLEYDRESIQKLKADAERYDVILCAEVSRLSRDPLSGRAYLEQFCSLGKPVYFKELREWTVNPNNPQPYDVRDIVVKFGQYFDAAWKYIKNMKTQIASGRRRELRNGKMSIGRVAIGYKRVKEGPEKNKWVLDESADLVRKVYSMYETMSTKEIAIALGMEKGNVCHILAYEPYYTGLLKVKTTNPDTKEVRTYDVPIPPIINKETFLRAETKRKQYAKSPVRRVGRLEFTRMLSCPFCGHSLVYSGGSWRCECGKGPAIKNSKLTAIDLASLFNGQKEEETSQAIKNKVQYIRGLEKTIAQDEQAIAKAKRTLDKAPIDLEDEARSLWFAAIAKKKRDFSDLEAEKALLLRMYQSKEKKAVRDVISRIFVHSVNGYEVNGHIAKKGAVVFDIRPVYDHPCLLFYYAFSGRFWLIRDALWVDGKVAYINGNDGPLMGINEAINKIGIEIEKEHQ